MNRSYAFALAVAIVVSALAPSAVSAQDSRLRQIRDDVTRDVVRQQIDLAATIGLPTEPFVAKALEGVAKKASTRRIRAAMNALQKRMQEARLLLAPSPTVDELAAGADAIGVGVPDNTLKLMRAAAPNRSIAMELGVLTELVAKGVPARQAAKMVLDLMARGAAGAQLTALSSAVQDDVAAGLKPDAALELRGRGIMSLLPLPPSVSTLNNRPGRP